MLVDDALPALLGRLQRALGGALAIVTGRLMEDIDRRLAPVRLPVAGLHGLELRRPDGSWMVTDASDELDAARADLAGFANRCSGVMLEDKGRAVALHFRTAPERAAACRAAAESAVRDRPDLHLVAGKMIFEIKPRAADKGTAVDTLMTLPPFAGRVPVFAGDDVTDEDAFKVVKRLQGKTIKVGDGETVARYRVRDVRTFLDWLSDMADLLDGSRRDLGS